MHDYAQNNLHTFEELTTLQLLVGLIVVRGNCSVQGFSRSETVGLPSDKAWKKAPPQPRFVYLLSFGQSLDACGMIMLFDPIDIQQLSQDSLTLLFDITSDYTKYIKKKVDPKAFISFWPWESGKTIKFPKTTVSLNYLFNQITHT